MNNTKTRFSHTSLDDIEDLIEAEEIELNKLDEIVEEALYDEEILSKKIQEIEEDKEITLGQRLSDFIAEFGGSWTFLISLGVFLLIWVLINTFTNVRYDIYPFILLNLLLSCVAAIQAPIIMMSQNRQEEKDRRRSRSDYMLNLKSEMEIQRLHKKIDKILELQKSQLGFIIRVQKTQIDSLSKIRKFIEKNESFK